MERNKFKIPRKLKKTIPVGMYCYKGIHFDITTGIYHIKLCGFYSGVKRGSVLKEFGIDTQEILSEMETDTEKEEYLNGSIGYCRAIKCEVDDQCKSCNFKLGKW